MVIRLFISAYADRTFDFKIKPPATTWFIKRCTGVHKFYHHSGHYEFEDIPIHYVYEIAKIKKELDHDLHNVDLQEICYMIIGQLRTLSMGISIDFNTPHEKENPPLKN